MKEGTAVLEHLNFFNRIIGKLLAVDVKVDEEDKTLILLSSLLNSYDHTVTNMLFGKDVLITKEVTTTLLSNEIQKQLNQDEQDTCSGVG